MATDREDAPSPLTLFQRAHYTLASGIAVTMILILSAGLLTLVVPEWELIPFLLSPKVYWVLVPLYVAAWVAAPGLSKRYPIAPWWRR